MRINKKVIVSMIALAFVFGSFAVSTTNAQQKNRVLRLMEQHKTSLSSLKASVKMSEYDAALKDETVKNGTVQYLPKPGKDAWVRIDWVTPNETIVVAGGKYIIYNQNINQAITGNVNDSKKQKSSSNALKFMGMSKRELDSSYDISYIDTPSISGVEVHHLKLTPKGADSFKEAEIWVDGSGMPVQAMIREKNNDETTIRLSSIRKNDPGFSDSVFAIDLKGVKIVKG